MENLRNRIDVKFVSNKKDYLEWTSKPSYMPHKIFDNDVVVIRKRQSYLNAWQTCIHWDVYFVIK